MRGKIRYLTAVLAFAFLLLTVGPGALRAEAAKAKIGLVQQGSATYCYDADGGLQTGFQKIDGKSYYFLKKNGKMAIGWLTIGKSRYYFDESGKMQIGLKKIDGKKYFFDKQGKLQTGFQTINKKTFYFLKKNGRMATGWLTVGKSRYYFDESGKMQTGLKKIDGKKYFFDKQGKMQTGFQTINKKTFYFLKKNGRMATGWLTIGKKRYYFGESGKMAIGWLTLDGKTYFFDEDGVMLTGRHDIEDKSFYFGKDGVMDPSRTTKRKLSKLEKLCEDIVSEKVKKTDSVNTKLNKLFQYVTWQHRYIRSYNFSAYKDWHKDYAYKMLTTKGGNCYSYACAFAYLAKKATDLEIRVGWGSTPAARGGLTPHGWCEIKINGTWYVFDPDLYRYVYSGQCYYKTMSQVGQYYYNRKYATVSF